MQANVTLIFSFEEKLFPIFLCSASLHLSSPVLVIIHNIYVFIYSFLQYLFVCTGLAAARKVYRFCMELQQRFHAVNDCLSKWSQSTK